MLTEKQKLTIPHRLMDCSYSDWK